jgi:glutamate-1-semialdehyde 2,1-aminomutase
MTNIKKNYIKGNALHKIALDLIPGGNSLLSKRREMFAPDQWPAYFDTAKGINVSDLDGNNFRDFSHFGVGTNTLGYGNESVDNAVLKCIKSGNMSSLNSPEEVYLADQLVQMHPWSNMVKFARSGGEANAIAIRIARAYTGKSKIAFCGYHGWHDWYLSANLKDKKNLDQQLLSGLSPIGVPKELSGTALPFLSEDLNALEKILSTGDVAAIKMEVMRSKEPTKEYLLNIRELADKYKCILIFDECTSGFRETFGGLHLKYGVHPDITVLGKTLGNGYAITAVLGTKQVMIESQSTFISSTFFTERLGYAAAIATLEEMQAKKSWSLITNIGRVFKNRVLALVTKYGLEIDLSGMDALASYNIQHTDMPAVKTYLTQEMLSHGFLSSNLFYPSIAHSQKDLDEFFDAFEKVVQNLSDLIKQGDDIRKHINGPVCHSGFKRLN